MELDHSHVTCECPDPLSFSNVGKGHRKGQTIEKTENFQKMKLPKWVGPTSPTNKTGLCGPTKGNEIDCPCYQQDKKPFPYEE